MKLIRSFKYLFYISKGALKFRCGEYQAAKQLLEKSLQCGDLHENDQFYQYYGQTLLALNEAEESFLWLAKAYEILNEKGWIADDDEEYKLLHGTLDALKYLERELNLSVDSALNEKKITMKM